MIRRYYDDEEDACFMTLRRLPDVVESFAAMDTIAMANASHVVSGVQSKNNINNNNNNNGNEKPDRNQQTTHISILGK